MMMEVFRIAEMKGKMIEQVVKRSAGRGRFFQEKSPPDR